MKKRLFGMFTALFLGLLLLTTTVSAQDEERKRRNSIVGAWRTTLTPRDCVTGAPLPVPSSQGLITFHKGGTVSDFIANGTTVFVTTRSPGHGFWKRDHGWSEFSYRLVFLRYTTAGAAAGRQEITGALTLNDDGDEFAVNSVARLFDVAGNLVATACSSLVGVRFE